MSNPSGPAHRSVANIRSPPSTNPAAPASPHTPLRTISSAFGSPSALRAEEDCVIFELGARLLRAGFAGDAAPKAIIDFGPEEQRRPGDYRKWEVGYNRAPQKEPEGGRWGEAYELWRPDLRALDLGLVGDKIDRAVREAFTKYLLIDSRPRRMVLVIPAALPLPLLSTILDTLFSNFQPPTISLMSSPVLTTVAAGLRSALVVDIGWAETVVTSIYEYRQVQCARSVRACKLLGEETFKTIVEAIDSDILRRVSAERTVKDGMEYLPGFETCEEVATRMAWCQSAKKSRLKSFPEGLTPVKEEDELRASMRMLSIGQENEAGSTVSIPLGFTGPATVSIPFSQLAEPCERALFASNISAEQLDDEELPLHLLVYRSLLCLPVDVRSMCMSRLIFVGGGSNVLGLKRRILDEVAILIETRGWNPVKGKAVEQFQTNSKLSRTRAKQSGPTAVVKEANALQEKTVPAGLMDQEVDPIQEQLMREASKEAPPIESGHLRAVDSLGAWSGGSLLSQLKVPAVSIIERDQWLQYGAAGASKPGEITITSHRQSMGPGVFKPGAVDRSSWTLGLWG